MGLRNTYTVERSAVRDIRDIGAELERGAGSSYIRSVSGEILFMAWPRGVDSAGGNFSIIWQSVSSSDLVYIQ
jgi:hypothetical protein